MGFEIVTMHHCMMTKCRTTLAKTYCTVRTVRYPISTQRKSARRWTTDETPNPQTVRPMKRQNRVRFKALEGPKCCRPMQNAGFVTPHSHRHEVHDEYGLRTRMYVVNSVQLLDPPAVSSRRSPPSKRIVVLLGRCSQNTFDRQGMMGGSLLDASSKAGMLIHGTKIITFDTSKIRRTITPNKRNIRLQVNAGRENTVHPKSPTAGSPESKVRRSSRGNGQKVMK